jgi:hypothetical protein
MKTESEIGKEIDSSEARLESIKKWCKIGVAGQAAFSEEIIRLEAKLTALRWVLKSSAETVESVCDEKRVCFCQVCGDEVEVEKRNYTIVTCDKDDCMLQEQKAL